MARPLRRALPRRPRTGSRPTSSARPASADIGADRWAKPLHALLPWHLQRRLDAEAPTHLEVPTGSRIPIDYGAEEGPVLAVRVQELFGLDRHPTIAGGRVPLVLHLLSPAQRPIQITRDLPGFWRGSWAAVTADMRGRYPEASLAGRSACGAADAAREAARREPRSREKVADQRVRAVARLSAIGMS